MDSHLISTVAQTVIFLLGVYGMVLRTDWNSKGLKDEIGEMKDELKKLAHVITIQAVQTKEIENLREQLVMLQRTVEELRRGNGYVRGRTGLDGEYP